MGGQLTRTEFAIFIFSIVFIVVYPILYQYTNLLIASGNISSSNIPQDFKAISYTLWAGYVDFFEYDSEAGYPYDVEVSLGSSSIKLHIYTTSYGSIAVQRYDSWWIFEWGHRNYRWYVYENSTLKPLGSETADVYWLDVSLVDLYWDDEQKAAYFQLRAGPKDTLHCYFTYNRAAYDGAHAAWQAGKLHVLIAAGIDQAASSMNLFTLIVSMIVFSPPGVDFPWNVIVCIPFQAMLGLFLFILITKIIPFL